MNNQSRFDSISVSKPTGTRAVLKELRNFFAEQGNPFSAYGTDRNIFSVEDFSDSETRQIDSTIEETAIKLRSIYLSTTGQDSSSSHGLESYGGETDSDLNSLETRAQAAIYGSIAASNGLQLHNRLNEQYERLRKDPTVIDSSLSVINSGFIDHGRIPEFANSMESYDEQENRNTMMYTYAFNLAAARQNKFGEAFFKTVVLAPDVASATISVDLLSVMEDYKRSIDGSFKFDFGRKSLVAAMVDHTILNKETNRIWPVYRDTSPTSKSNFVDETIIQPWEVTLENEETIKTSALAFGASFDLLSLGSADHLVADGPLDFTDQIDQGIRLSSIFIKLKNGDVIQYDNLDLLPEAQFVYQPSGRSRSMGLTFELTTAVFTKDTLKFDKTPVTPNAATNNDYRVHLNIGAYGSINTDDAFTSVQAGKVTVNAIYDSNNNKLDIKTGPGKTAADEFEGAEAIGYTLYANRINSNRRERGQIVDLNRHRQIYNIPILAPISIVRPTSDDDASYAARLDSLVTTTHIGCSNAAVTTLFSARDALSSLPPIMEPQLVYNSEVLGPARFYVTPHYSHVDLDVLATINTLSSANRIVDVNAVLINVIREEVFKAYQLSNYQAARDVLKGDQGDKKPHVVIGTDPKIAAYLQIIGDTRSLGDNFNFEIVSSPDKRMINQIFIAFGEDGSGGAANEVCNPLSFGVMFWRPEITSVLQISRRGQTSKELTVQPSYRHIVQCPILISIKVDNLAEAVTKMIPINNKTAP